MISFLLNIYRLLVAIVDGVRTDAEFRALGFLLVTLLGSATLFYWQYEGWRPIDALYFSVVTMATIGYGDFSPSSDAGKVFTMIYAFLSIGVFVAFNAKIVSFTLNRQQRGKHPDR